MNKVKKVISSPFFAIGAFVLAAVLLLSAGIGGASAALNAQSDIYTLSFDAEHIGVQVCEDGTAAEKLTLSHVPSDSASIVEDKVYAENLTVQNPSTTTLDDGTVYSSIPEYVRVIIHKYWTVTVDGKEVKLSDNVFNGNKINLTYGSETDGWHVQSTSDSGERVIMTYANVLNPGSETKAFVTGISFDVDLTPYLSSKTTTEQVTGEGNSKSFTTTTTTTFDYEGYGIVKCVVEVEAQGVQTHNARQAMISSWGYVPANVVTEED